MGSDGNKRTSVCQASCGSNCSSISTTAYIFCYRDHPATYSTVAIEVTSGASEGVVDVQGDLNLEVTYSVTGTPPTSCSPTVAQGSFPEWSGTTIDFAVGSATVTAPRTVQNVEFGIDCVFPGEVVIGETDPSVTLNVAYLRGTTAPDDSGIMVDIYYDTSDDLIAHIVPEGGSIGTAPWGCVGTYVQSSDPNTYASYGLPFSEQIVAECSERPIAASMALDYVSPSGHDDWYLLAYREAYDVYDYVLSVGTWIWTARESIDWNTHPVEDYAFAMRDGCGEYSCGENKHKSEVLHVVPMRRATLPLNP